MLTSRQREECRRIAEALDAGNQSVWLRAEASLSAEQKALIWDQRQEQVARGAQCQRRVLPMGNIPQNGAVKNLGTNVPTPENEALARDLDNWDDEPGLTFHGGTPDDDDDSDDTLCGACHGTGRDVAGNVCRVCKGTGKALNEDEDVDDEQREDED
jgi:hypothetical protein